MEKGRLLEPRSPSGQNARLRSRIEKETEGLTLVSTRHSPRQFPLHPYSEADFHDAREFVTSSGPRRNRSSPAFEAHGESQDDPGEAGGDGREQACRLLRVPGAPCTRVEASPPGGG